MYKTFLILRTQKGGMYARKILRSIQWINENRKPHYSFITEDLTISEFMEYPLSEFSAENTVIHPRCAHPDADWIEQLELAEEMGYKVVNSTETIRLTSDKLECALRLQDIVPHPKTWEFSKNWSDDVSLDFVNEIWKWAEQNHHYIIAKPLTSLSQGAHVRKISLDTSGMRIVDQLRRVPGTRIVVQEFFPYTMMHRVIVIDGRALPYTFVDKVEWHQPGDWKVSCCLNTTTMKINENPDSRVLRIAERTQSAVNGVINFIDIFECDDYRPLTTERFSISEINTACSLRIHERLAREAGRSDWNIHAAIARQLVRSAGV